MIRPMTIAYRATAAVACLSLLAACSGGGDHGRPSAGPATPASAAPAPSLSPGPSRTPQAPPFSTRWKEFEKLPLLTTSGLVDVVATGPRQAWALGYEDGAEDSDGSTVVLRWNGTAWSKLPGTPAVGGYDGLDAGGPDDLWIAAGDTVAHWDGRRWTRTRPFGISEDKSFDDVATDGDTAVLIGASEDGAPFIVTGRNDRFRLQFSPEGVLDAVTSGSGHAWIVGAAPHRDCAEVTPLVVHSRKAGREGYGQWEAMRVPLVPGGTLTSVVQITPTDVWAVGKIVENAQAERIPGRPCGEWVSGVLAETDSPALPLALHWDGRSWKQVALPPMNAELTGVTAFGPDDVWVAARDRDRPDVPVFLRFDGRGWTAERAGRGTVTAVAAIPGTKDLWAVGWPGEYTDDGREYLLRRGGRGRPG